MENTYDRSPDACKVLAISSAPSTLALVRRLADSDYLPPVPLTEGEASMALTVESHEFSYAAVAVAARELQGSAPFALAIVDIQPTTEVIAEQLIGALYHTDLRLQIVVLLSPGSVPGKPLLDVMNRSNRLACLRMPCDADDLSMVAKLMTAKWVCERKLETHKSQPAETAGPERTTAQESDSPPSGREAGNQSVNLAAIGSLASGIAHEFNNFLTVVQSQMGIAMQQARSLPGVVSLLKQVMESAHNASKLSRKLVSLTPQETSSPTALNLGNFVDEEVAMLRKTLGEHLVLKTEHAADTPEAWADPAIVGQIIVNVAVHAKSAMQGGGTLQFSTRVADLEAGGKLARAFPGTRHGRYVMLSIEDPDPAQESEGAGDVPLVSPMLASLDQSPNDRLAWIRETLVACGGAFNVTLIPGMIRHYQLLFPVAEGHVEIEASPAPALSAGPSNTHPATILVVDDDETICMVMTQVLGSVQHRVLTAANADEGWSQWRQNRGTIKLLITDINMPGGANGVALGKAVQEEDGSVPVIYTSGYRATAQFADLIAGANYLPKPFGMNDLLTVVRSNLVKHERHGLD